jgi:hypothetical protein
MNPKHALVALVVLLLPAGLTPVWSQGKVLVPGNPPLTQGLWEKRPTYLEWLLDARFGAKERDAYQRLVLQDWKTATATEQRQGEQIMLSMPHREGCFRPAPNQCTLFAGMAGFSAPAAELSPQRVCICGSGPRAFPVPGHAVDAPEARRVVIGFLGRALVRRCRT